MELHKPSNATEFIKKTEDFLMQNESVNNLMIGLAFRLREGKYPCENPFFAYAEENGKVVAAFLRTPPHLLIVTPESRNYQQMLIFDLLDSMPGLPGVLGPKKDAQAFAKTWVEKTHLQYKLVEDMRIYQCDKLIVPPNIGEGQLVQVEKEHREIAQRWSMQFNSEALHDHPLTPDQAREYVKRKIEQKELYLWQVNGEFVSMAGAMGKTPNGIRLGAIYTPKEFRKQGHATACTAALTRKLFEDGNKFCFLYTDLNNPTSNAIYQKIGYRPVCDSQNFRFS